MLERMATPCFVESADERVLVRLQEEHLHSMAAGLDLIERLEQVREVLPFPDIHAEGDPGTGPGGSGDQIGKGRDEGGGEIVYAEETHVLEALDGVALASATEASDHDEGDGRGLHDSLPRQQSPLMRGQDPQLLPVLGHRTTGDGEPAPFQVVRDLLIGQGLGGILGSQMILNHLLD